jgi:hypothetical protein
MFGLSAEPRSGRYLSFAEREEIALLPPQGYNMQGSLAGSGERRRRFLGNCGATPFAPTSPLR